MRYLANASKRTDIKIGSAGTAGYHIGKKPDNRMTAELNCRGIEVTGHAEQFKYEYFDDYDLIIAMDDENQRNILKLARCEEDKAKVKPFMSFCKTFTDKEVPDPYYGGQEGFVHVANLMEEGCQGILDSLS